MKKKSYKGFLLLPKVTGGKKTFVDFLSQNLVYPEEALENQVEGNVLVEYEVDDNGFVTKAKIVKGLGYGLDEEALRLIMMLRFEKVKNRGVRLRSSGKINIPFRLPTTVVYKVVPTNANPTEPTVATAESNNNQRSGTISYTIEF